VYAQRSRARNTGREMLPYCTPCTRRGRSNANAALLTRLRGFTESEPRWLHHFQAIGGSALTDGRIAVPENRLDEARAGSTIPVTYVPFRNAHFLSVGVSWAESIGAGALYIGAVAEDSSGYPDCRPEYYRVFQELIRVGTKPETRIEMVTPVIAMKKSEIVRRGRELGAPLHLTWSCYQGEELACGKCDSCLLRLRAIAEAGTEDPIRYQKEAPRPV